MKTLAEVIAATLHIQQHLVATDPSFRPVDFGPNDPAAGGDAEAVTSNDTITGNEPGFEKFDFWNTGGKSKYTEKPPSFTRENLPTSKAAANAELVELDKRWDDWAAANGATIDGRREPQIREQEERAYRESPFVSDADKDKPEDQRERVYHRKQSLHNLLRETVGYGGG